MPKRTYGSAFRTSTPTGMLVAANGFGTPQSQAQRSPQFSQAPSFHIPGQWPSDETVTQEPSETTRKSTLFTTVGRWATTVFTATNISTISQSLLQRFWHKQQIRAFPVIGNNGSNKKRFIDAGFADVHVTPSPSRRAKLAHRRRGVRATTPSLDAWSRSLDLDETPPQFTSPLALAQVCDDLRRTSTLEDDEDNDSRNEFFFNDVLTSTPPPPLSTASKKRQGTLATRVACPQITPMRRHLLKLQLRTQTEAQEQSYPVPENPAKTSYEDPAHLSEASSSTFQSDVNSSPFQSDVASSPFQPDADSSPLQSRLPDAVAPEYENDLSFLSDASPLPYTKRVRWAEHAGAKKFYMDEKVGEMLDSTIESINFSPVRPSWNYHDKTDVESGDETEDESQSVSTHSEALAEGHNEPPSGQSDDDGDYKSVLADTSEKPDKSLDESQLSQEIMQDLQENLQKKLALAPPLPGPVKPLVVPLSSEELRQLEDAAAKTEYGRQWQTPVVPEKQLLAKDFGTLLPHQFNGDPKAWLNDQIVNEYLSILVAHKKKEKGFEHKRGGPAPPVHAFSSFWYSTVKDRPESVMRWAFRSQLQGDQYLDADLLLYPICDAGHWRLLVVYPKERSIDYLDSLGFSGDKYVKKLKEYLKAELKASWNEDEWSVDEVQRSSRQLNGSDCGVFTLLNALALLRGEDASRVIACCGMADARERIATTLLAGEPTEELD